MQLGLWLLIACSAPVLLVAGYLLLARQWVRYLGRPAVATVLDARQVATLPHMLTEVTLDMTPLGEPAYVRLRARARWSEQSIDPALLVAGTRLRVRYRLGRPTIVMPDARREASPDHGPGAQER